MESFIISLKPFLDFLVEIIIVLLVFLYVVKPLLNYFILNREIENRKKLAREYAEAKKEAEAQRKGVSGPEETSWTNDTSDTIVDELTQNANKNLGGNDEG